MPSHGVDITDEGEDEDSASTFNQIPVDIFHLEQEDKEPLDNGKNGTKLDDNSCTKKDFKPKRRLPRTMSECSTCSTGSDIDIVPLGLDDITFPSKDGYVSSDEEFSYEPTVGGRFFKVAQGIKNRTKKKIESRGLRNWRRAMRLIKDRGDPWEKFGLDTLKSEKGIRHRYNPVTQVWVTDECVLKVDRKPFANGAMRECFRMKKLSNFSGSEDWLRDSNNFVAKRYMDENTPRDMYFQDVKLQMDAKLWGEEFNRHNPPKKVDIFMMAVIELVDRSGSPLYHVEHYIDGNYVKYNSNSGFVDFGFCRQTPQAFSHFTFERSGHNLVVVDIQGVGDLYTDPQIHTAEGEEYGDGNLGTRGMALFFHSHMCNKICQSLGLTAFDLSGNEKTSIVHSNSESVTSETCVRMKDVICCESPPSSDFKRILRQRSGSWYGLGDEEFGHGHRRRLISTASSECLSGCSTRQHSECESGYHPSIHIDEIDEDNDPDEAKLGKSPPELPEDGIGEDDEEGVVGSYGGVHRNRHVSFSTGSARRHDRQNGDTETSTDSGVPGAWKGWKRQRRQRGITECLDGWEGDKGDELRSRMERVSRPSCIQSEIGLLSATGGGESILGQIHLDLAKYHETCRFDCDFLDRESALFHLRAAADCGNLSALVAISQLFCGLPNDILPALTTEDIQDLVQGELKLKLWGNREIEDIGLDYMTTAARCGDASSCLYLAKAYDSGMNLGKDRKQSYTDCLMWYETALKAHTDQPYLVMARMAEILLLEQPGLTRNPQRAGELFTEAAEAAMEDMKGKLANKYYMKAEEAWAECEDEEE